MQQLQKMLWGLVEMSSKATSGEVAEAKSVFSYLLKNFLLRGGHIIIVIKEVIIRIVLLCLTITISV